MEKLKLLLALIRMYFWQIADRTELLFLCCWHFGVKGGIRQYKFKVEEIKRRSETH